MSNGSSFSKFKPVTIHEVPPHLCSDYCIRCLRPFKNKNTCAVVSGSRNARYRDIAIEVCHGCVDKNLDIQKLLTIYFRDSGQLPVDNNEKMKPIFYSNWPLEGFLKMSLIETGFWRIGLHRGHCEVWTTEEKEKYTDEGIEMAYAKDSLIFGASRIFKPGTFWRVIRVEFLSLADPRQLTDRYNIQ